jgi:viroplasmin and RNaseH domain-containing protein
MVLKGNVLGVYNDWHDCLAQVNKFFGNIYQGYKTKEEMKARYKKRLRKKNRIFFIVIAVPLYLIVV